MRSSIEDRLQLLRSNPAFSSLGRQDAELLLATSLPETFAPEELVFSKGEPGDCAFLVAAGHFVAFDPATPNTVRRSFRPGDLFGEYALFTGGTRTLSIRCTEGGTLLPLAHDRFHAFLQIQPTAAIQLLATTVRRLAETEQELLALRTAGGEPDQAQPRQEQ